MRRFRLCQHTKDNGELCGSPAMRRKNYCYFHLEVVARRRRMAARARRQKVLTEAKAYDDRILGLRVARYEDLEPLLARKFAGIKILR
jgi:hypothetical protein